MREQHEPDEDRCEQRSARDEREGQARGGQPRGLVETSALPMADRERNDQQSQREKYRDEDREPDRLGEKHAPGCYRARSSTGKGRLSRAVSGPVCRSSATSSAGPAWVK